MLARDVIARYNRRHFPRNPRMPSQRLTLTRPDDWHLHLRDGAHMEAVLGDSARCFARAIVMPNLKPPITTTQQARAYRARILAALPSGMEFEPLMTLYLTDRTPAAEIAAARASGVVQAVKYYPAGATTNSDSGVTNLRHCHATLEAMQKLEMPLLVHGEVTDPEVDVFDREAVFIERILIPLRRDFPALRMVFEHVTTRQAVEYVLACDNGLAATITAHHLLLNRNAMFRGGMRPHHYCLPVLKRDEHRRALLTAATSGDPRFFLGTDSAPHGRNAKETDCGCAGIYTAHAALELYAEAFESAAALDRLEGFASHFGADFYRLARNHDSLTLEKKSWRVANELEFDSDVLVPLRAGEEVGWRLCSGAGDR